MPMGRESPSAPCFPPTPLSITHYFAALEKLFSLCKPAVTGGGDKIDWACFYTDNNTYELWAQIHDGMDDVDKNLYEDFKTKTLKDYPGAGNNKHQYATWDLDNLVHKDFYSISTWLIKHNRISVLDQQKSLLCILKFLPTKSCLWDKMLNRLKRKYDRAVDKPWTMAKLKETAEWALGNTTTKVQPLSPDYLQDASPAPVPVDVKTESNPQVANFTGCMANLEGMVSVRATQAD
ncbi:hypothetical protein DACRYDRAFT_112743 [Dacryopinax primogenitus]|uniref:Uncharacterized protein n=1 Tax=Dacryopinax primogenitus (strain DJM 731) TaxID=1858805 RepID=M5FPI3_DACPD|nr:uncharacterized protein DACRYDRAFT_112743 [Dacryopinax primogenitus]EJT96459.1 hypothetical protein DACRYDRAFT_112743 [Dacryopinax primogenitus]